MSQEEIHLDVIRFNCGSCGRQIKVPGRHAGKKGRCPQCKNPLSVPDPAQPIADTNEPPAITESMFQPPSETANVIDTYSHSTMPKPEPPAQRKLPWVVDIFLYPISKPGLIILAVIFGVPFMFKALGEFVKLCAVSLPALVVFYIAVVFIALVVNIVVGLYAYWYICHCVRESAAGGIRSPDMMTSAPGVGELLWQFLKVGICLLVFAAPSLHYFWNHRQIDTIFWAVVAGSSFFFPMGLLAVIMFDSVIGLNPLLIIRSIFSTLFPYCGLIVLYLAVGYGGVQLLSLLQLLLVPWWILGPLYLYLFMVLAHLLGRFYFRYEEKLYWEV